jgi:hypothetical protein
MGCGLAYQQNKIQKTTAIQILDEEDLKLGMQGISMIKFKFHGQKMILHYKCLSSLKNN